MVNKKLLWIVISLLGGFGVSSCGGMIDARPTFTPSPVVNLEATYAAGLPITGADTLPEIDPDREIEVSESEGPDETPTAPGPGAHETTATMTPEPTLEQLVTLTPDLEAVLPTPAGTLAPPQEGTETTGDARAPSEELMAAGQAVFTNTCAGCHQASGQGMADVAPALANNRFVTRDDPVPVIDTVLHGRNQMPAYGDRLSDREIAAVLTFVRNSWGNRAGAISPEQVEARR